MFQFSISSLHFTFVMKTLSATNLFPRILYYIIMVFVKTDDFAFVEQPKAKPFPKGMYYVSITNLTCFMLIIWKYLLPTEIIIVQKKSCIPHLLVSLSCTLVKIVFFLFPFFHLFRPFPFTSFSIIPFICLCVLGISSLSSCLLLSPSYSHGIFSFLTLFLYYFVVLPRSSVHLIFFRPS